MLAEKLSIPVATSLNAKAIFPYDHPLALGVPGHYSRACANQAVCEADLVFFIGSHTGGQVTHEWRIPPQGTPIVQLDEFIAGLADGSIDLWAGPLNFQDGSPFLADGEAATPKQIWYMSQLLEGIDGASSAEG